MRVAGITFDSEAIDVVVLEQNEPRWRRAELLKAGSAFERALTIRPRVEVVCPGGWDEVGLIAVERPALEDVGYLADAMRIQGAVLACLFAVTHDVDLVEKPAHIWRLALLGYTPAGGDDVINRLLEVGIDLGTVPHQQAWNAAALAWTAREERRQQAVFVAGAEGANGVGK